jgi:Cu+-exporting ATPase
MTIDPAHAIGDIDHQGTTYYFCSQNCMRTFAAHPESYVDGSDIPAATPAVSAPSAAAAYTCPMHPEVRQATPGDCPRCGMALEPAIPLTAAKTEWTCPMHPEIVRDAPGSCPICGMALEPRTVSAGDTDNPELRDMTRRFWVATAFTTPLALLVMADMLPGRPLSALLTMSARPLIELALAAPVCLWAAWPFYVRAVQSVVNRSLNMFTLIGLGVSVAFVYSMVAALFPDVFPPSFREQARWRRTSRPPASSPR